MAAYLAIRRCRASRLSGVPRRVTNSGSLGRPPRSASQACRTVPVAAVSGVIRRFRPLPRQLTCAPGAQVHVAHGQAGELGGAEPGLAGQHQQGVVASPGPGAAVGRRQQRGDLFLGEVGDQGPVEAFGWDRQHPLDDRGVLRVAQRGVAEQRVNGRQPGVAGPDAVAAVGFQMVEERADQWCVQVGDVQAEGGLPVRWSVKTSSSLTASR